MKAATSLACRRETGRSSEAKARSGHQSRRPNLCVLAWSGACEGGCAAEFDGLHVPAASSSCCFVRVSASSFVGQQLLLYCALLLEVLDG